MAVKVRPPIVWADAITDDHDHLDTGRLSLFLVMWVCLGSIPIMLTEACIQAQFAPDHVFPFAEFGKGAGLVTAAFATALAALAAYIRQDKLPTAPPPVLGPSGEKNSGV